MLNKPKNNFTRSSKPDWMRGVGPYIGRIVNHLDPDYMGSVEVEILKISEAGNLEETSGYLIPCTYVSPFMGVTPRSGVRSYDSFVSTQKSYGFWAVPPDIGVKVLVLMAENNYGFGYWIGCIQDNYMNFMTPGNSSTTYNPSKRLWPVGEYNKRTAISNENKGKKDPTQYIKPMNDDQIDILSQQGIQDDQTRGTNTSSARRETPSMVFGWNTPGPYDRRSGKPKVAYGERLGQAEVPFNRLGGSSFVMDDGDEKFLRKNPAKTNPPEYAAVEKGESGDVTLPHNELIRLKTRTGHQILMHNTEDLIYIINAQGTTWIELTSNGKIDIYAKDSVSLHTEQDINLKADRDFNFEALRNINIKAHNEIYIESGEMTNMKIGTNPDGNHLFIETSKNTHLKTGTHSSKGHLYTESTLTTNITADTDLYIKSGKTTHMKSSSNMFLQSNSSTHIKSSASMNLQSGSTTNVKAGSSMNLQSGNSTNVKAGSSMNLQSGSDWNAKAGGDTSLTADVNFQVNARNSFLTSMLTNNFKAMKNGFSPGPSLGAASGGRASSAGSAGSAESAITAILPDDALEAYLPIRIPNHEPWLSHENLYPNEFTPEKTDSLTRTPQVDIPYIITPDTFRKGL